jgi:hypothetical protein
VCAAAVAGGAALPAFAVAQEPDTVPRPFVDGGAFDKPYLFNLAGRAAFGGYADAQARYERVDGASESGFELTRFNLFTSARVSDFVRFGAELEFEEAGADIKLEFATVDLTVHPSFAFRMGMILVPLGRFNLAHDSPRNEFTDRPLVSTEVLGVALSDAGLGALGTLPIGGAGRITYEAYLVNGFHDGVLADSPEGTRIPRGRANLEDNNGSPAGVARVAWSPGRGYEIGISGHRGRYNVFEPDGLRIDEPRDLSIWVVDLELSPWGFRLSGEAAWAAIEIPPDLEDTFASSQAGVYLEVLRDFGVGWIPTMPNSHFTAGIRLDAVDFDTDREGDDVDQITVGLNFRPTQDTVFKLDYMRGREFDGFNNRADLAKVLFSVATYF